MSAIHVFFIGLTCQQRLAFVFQFIAYIHVHEVLF